MGEQEFEAVQTKQGVEVVRKVKQRILDYSAYYLTADEIKRMKDAALRMGHGSTKYLAMLVLMSNCGLRRGEVLGLKCRQVNFDGKLIELGIETKTRTPRSIPFNTDVETTLRSVVGDRIGKDDYVFKHKSAVQFDGKLQYSERRYSPVSLNLIVARIGREAGIAPKADGMVNINPHLLRHSWVKLCKDRGVPEDFVQVMGGWASRRMIKEVYGVPTYDNVIASVKEKVNW